ncbi:galectin-3 [Drosophila serrata]|uniref:galectin-3 n=1 Tax=Drosophila serrata TaxID=7274 RepID=UPI000A1D0A65|nr:galectin-3 [Drosophila serrata]KAH8362398.1 hypothetical protein KR200_001727 [Drosophila serrata]
MSNSFSYWNGQPVNAPVYPQMGDLMQPQPQQPQQQHQPHPQMGRGAAAAAPGGFGSGGWTGQGAATRAHSSAALPGSYPSAASPGQYPTASGTGLAGMPMQGMNPGAQMGMGDYGNVSSPLTCNVPTNFFSQGQNQYEPCIDNGEAFCAYNGMDMSMNYGGTQGKGGFW